MLSKFKIKLLESVRSKKLNVFGFFFLMAFLFLVFTKLSKTNTDTIVFKIRYENVPEEHSISASKDSLIYVKVKAYGLNLVSHKFYNHTISVNFKSDVQNLNNKYKWSTKKGISNIKKQLGSKIEVLSIEPDSLSFPFETMMVKTVPVKLNVDVMYASGYNILEGLKIHPDSVKVIGPKNMIDKISKIRTKSLKLKSVNSSINESLGLVLDTSWEAVSLSTNSVKISGVVEKFTEGVFEVPVSIINLPTDLKINYFPKMILVSYYVSLENFKTIKPSDFKIVCDYQETLNQDRTYFTPHLISESDWVKNTKMNQNKVEFIILE